ncbi:MBL fold metallo-hydrolase [Pendulispora brunnea]|uniref:MBL fold metallo-hydrolase n=1 Tax=Pendulispora brunnea TaxID=2905690 RepID=A0ABZ2K0S2_9BACT
MDGVTKHSLRGRLASHCLLLETGRSLALIDTGYGLPDIAHPRSRLSNFFLALLKPELHESMTAVRQIQRLGFDPKDVQHIVLSHLDFDHAGGLDDFPQATVHLLGTEIDSAASQKTVIDRLRYRPQQWNTRAQWRGYAADAGEAWFGFEHVRELEGIGPEVLMVPLIGHTLGHAGVAIRCDERWLLYAADAYFFHAEMDERPRCTPGLRLYQTMMEKNRRLRLLNQRRLRQLRLASKGEIDIFCAHDIGEFEQHGGHSHHEPAQMARPAQKVRPVDVGAIHSV